LKLTGMAELFNLYNYARYNRNQIYNNALFGSRRRRPAVRGRDRSPSGFRSEIIAD